MRAAIVGIASWLIMATSSAAEAPPPEAVSAGYITRTFATYRFSPETVDDRQTYARGYPWYAWRFFGGSTERDAVALNADGSVILHGGHSNGQLASAAAVPEQPYFVGKAFGCGGYFKAVLKFDPRQVDKRFGWPSWWTMALEHLDGDHGNEWRGLDPRFKHYAEADIFEYSRQGGSYYATLHDWFGIYRLTCKEWCDVSNAPNNLVTPPAGTDFSQFHAYGMLWVPATKAIPGTVTWYFDGKPMLTRRYAKLDRQPPPTSAGQPWTFGIMDQQHMVLMLGSGHNSPMTVRSVEVWQGPGACDVSN